jgi:hypothetical protein
MEPIWIGSIMGQIKLSDKGHLGDYPHPVWYYPNGAANILSLSNVSRSNRVTTDTRQSQAIQVHMKDGSTINFTLTNNGLWVHHVNNPQYVQNMWLLLSTVSEKKQLYTKGAYKHSVMAHKLQNIIMHPSTWKFQDSIIDQMGDCPVTKADIQAADLVQTLDPSKERQYRDKIPMCQQVSIQYQEMFFDIYHDVTTSRSSTKSYCSSLSHVASSLEQWRHY